VKRVFLLILLVAACALPASAYRILYAEQYYRLYHEHFYHYPDDTMESIHYLELALKSDFAPFANPLYALATIRDKTEWERYRNLFYMHVNVKLIYLYLTLGSKYDKMIAYFYNYPWKRQNLESLETAEKVYKVAYGYWEDARKWSARAWGMRRVHLEQIQQWEDENFRIETGDLDYREIIDEQLARLARVRETFQKMDSTTY
jgi:hypothetical protein